MQYGFTALILAAGMGNREMVELLVQRSDLAVNVVEGNSCRAAGEARQLVEEALARGYRQQTRSVCPEHRLGWGSTPPSGSTVQWVDQHQVLPGSTWGMA